MRTIYISWVYGTNPGSFAIHYTVNNKTSVNVIVDGSKRSKVLTLSDGDIIHFEIIAVTGNVSSPATAIDFLVP